MEAGFGASAGALSFARSSPLPERPGKAEDAVSPAWRPGSRSRPSGDVSNNSEDNPRSWGGKLQATTDHLRRAPDRSSSTLVSASPEPQRCALPCFPLFRVRGLVQFSCSVVSDSLRPHDCSTPALPVHHQFVELTQTHVHRVGDAIQPSHPLSSPSPPAPNPSHAPESFPISQLLA